MVGESALATFAGLIARVVLRDRQAGTDVLDLARDLVLTSLLVFANFLVFMLGEFVYTPNLEISVDRVQRVAGVMSVLGFASGFAIDESLRNAAKRMIHLE